MSARIAVLGDSVGYGVGDESAEHPDRGLGRFLREAFGADAEYTNFARPGARALEVVAEQLPAALERSPDVAVVIAGGNDVLRSNYRPVEVHAALHTIISSLRTRGAEVVTLRLHDPCELIRLPNRIQRVLRRRIDALNRVIDHVADDLDALLVDARQLGNVYDKSLWHVDRMHPSPLGYFRLAEHVCERLTLRGFDLNPLTLPSRSRSRRVGQMLWLVRNGVPWFVKRCGDLIPGMLFLWVCEVMRDAVTRVVRVTTRGHADGTIRQLEQEQPRTMPRAS